MHCPLTLRPTLSHLEPRDPPVSGLNRRHSLQAPRGSDVHGSAQGGSEARLRGHEGGEEEPTKQQARCSCPFPTRLPLLLQLGVAGKWPSQGHRTPRGQ